MAVNYESVKEEDGTWTIKDVEVAATGKWYPANPDGTPAGLFDLDGDRLDEIVAADAEAHDNIQPVIQNMHAFQGPDAGKLMGYMGPIKRSGDKLLADLRGLKDSIHEFVTSGLAGRISPEIWSNFPEAATETIYPTVMTGIVFTGAERPAIPTLQSIATFSERQEDADKGQRLLLYAMIDEPTAKERADEEERKMEEKVLEERAAALKAKEEKAEAAELAFMEKQTAEAKAQEEREAAFHKQVVETCFAQAVDAGKIDPAKTEEKKAFAMGLTTPQAQSYFAQLMEGPNAVLKKNSDAKGTPTGDGTEDERSFEEKIRGKAMEFVEKHPDLPMSAAYGFAMKSGVVTDKEYQDYRERNFKHLAVAKKREVANAG